MFSSILISLLIKISISDFVFISKRPVSIYSFSTFLGVNINSRFEKEHGVKDMGKVLAFVQGTK